MRMEFLWLALIVVFAVIEGATTALTTVWFIGGALAALAAALLHAELWLQITLFFAVSVVLLAALRPLVKKYLRPRTVRTNAAGNIGREAIVTEAIDNLHETMPKSESSNARMSGRAKARNAAADISATSG